MTQQDSLGRSWVVTGNSGQRVSYTYDNNDNVKTRTDAASRQTADAQNRVAQVKAPDGGITIYGYDTAGRQATAKNADGVTIMYAWDAIGRLKSRTSGGVAEVRTYDAGTYGKGRLTGLSDATGTTSYTYTAAGELTQQVNTIVGNSYTTTWGYDTPRRLVSLTSPAGFMLRYGYDAYGRVSTITSNLTAAPWTTVADSFLYEPATNRLYGWRYASAVPRLVTLDTDTRISALASLGKHDLAFTYSNVDLVSGKTDGVYPATDATYAYDNADRLKTVTTEADPQGFVLDTAGGQTSQTRQGVMVTIKLDTASNRILSGSDTQGNTRSFGYNLSGSFTRDTRNAVPRVYGYDGFGRMSSGRINGSQVGDYRSDALNQRADRGAGGVGSRYVCGTRGELPFEIWIGRDELCVVRGRTHRRCSIRSALRVTQRPTRAAGGADEWRWSDSAAGAECGLRPRGDGRHYRRNECWIPGGNPTTRRPASGTTGTGTTKP